MIVLIIIEFHVEISKFLIKFRRADNFSRTQMYWLRPARGVPQNTGRSLFENKESFNRKKFVPVMRRNVLKSNLHFYNNISGNYLANSCFERAKFIFVRSRLCSKILPIVVDDKMGKKLFFSLVLSKTKNECWQKCFHLFSKSKPKEQRVLSSFDMYHRLPRNFVRTALYSVKLICNSCRILKCILTLRISFLVVLWIFDAHNLFKSLKLRYFYWQIINKHTNRRIWENSDTMQNLENKTI